MGYKEKGKIIKMGQSSKGIVLPKAWLDYQGEENLKELSILGDSILIISTKDDEEKARRLMDLYEKGASPV